MTSAQPITWLHPAGLTHQKGAMRLLLCDRDLGQQGRGDTEANRCLAADLAAAGDEVWIVAGETGPEVPGCHLRRHRVPHRPLDLAPMPDVVLIGSLAETILANIRGLPAVLLDHGGRWWDRLRTDDDRRRVSGIVLPAQHLVVGGGGRPHECVVHPGDSRTAAAGRGQCALMPGSTQAKGRGVLLALAARMPDIPFAMVHAREDAPGAVQPNVEVVPGPIPEADLLAKTRVLVVPSERETFGMAARHAAAAGRPVLARNLPGLREACGAAAVYLSDDLDEWEAALRAAWTRPGAVGTRVPDYDRAAEIAALRAFLAGLVRGPATAVRPAAAAVPLAAEPVEFPPGSCLHLGCGGLRLGGWINTDGRPEQAPDAVVDVYRTALPAARFAAIYACHLLEHLYPEETIPTLLRWHAALQPGGTLRLSVPDLRLILQNTVKSHAFGPNPDPPLFGDFRKEAHEWDRHKRAFTVEILTRLLAEAGFVNVRPWRVAQYPEIAAARDWASFETISLNLEADRPPGGPEARTPEQAPLEVGGQQHLDLSVIIGTWNRLDLLRRFVASVRQSLGGTKLTHEIVIADGGSEDGTREWVVAQPDCRLVGGGQEGAIPAFNAAYAAGRGEFVLHANDDTEIVGDAIPRALDHLRLHRDVAQVVFTWSRDGGKTWKYEGTKKHPHPNQAVTRRIALEDVIAHELGAFWGDADHRTDNTYGGDSYLGVVLARRGWQAVLLPDTVRLLDRVAEDPLRQRNRKRLNRTHGARWGTMARAHDVDIVPVAADAWPRCYVPEPGRLPRRSPVEAGPPERVLLLPITTNAEPQRGMRGAMAAIGPYEEVCYVDLPPRGRAPAVLAAVERHRPTLVLAQVQADGMLDASLWPAVRQAAGPGCLVALWNGDVRWDADSEPEPWVVQHAVRADLSLWDNATDPAKLLSLGAHGGYLSCGYDDRLSRPVPPVPGEDLGVVFTGMNYTSLDGGRRQGILSRLAQASGASLSVYGAGWHEVSVLRPVARPFVPEAEAALLYARARVTLSMSLYQRLRRYTSDRLKRVLGSGGVCAFEAFADFEGLGIQNGVHALVWRDEADLHELLADWLRAERDPDREAIRLAGHELATRTMTWRSFVEYLLAIVRAERLRRAS